MQYISTQIRLLGEVTKFNILKVLAYPWEWVAFFFQRFISLAFLALFWFAVAQGSSINLNFRQLLAYFLVSSAVRDLIFSTDTRFGRVVMRMIKTGEISNYLIKPIRTIPFLFFTFVGQNWMAFVYSLITLFLGFIILPPLSIFNVIAFIIFIIPAFFIGLSFNLFVANVSFYVIEANGIRNMSNHIIRFFSGYLIPLNLFPSLMRELVMLLPFPFLLFTPTYVLQNQLSFDELLRLFLTSSFWAVFLIFIMIAIWKKSLKKYEGVGI